ncbi:aspartate aminotransferase family protein [Scytonema sp. NUACC21]
MIQKKIQSADNVNVELNSLNHFLSKYSQYILPNSGLGEHLLKSSKQLFKSLNLLRTDTNLTVSHNLTVESELNLDVIPQEGISIEKVIQNIIIKYLGNVPNYSSNYSLSNVIPPSLIPAILAKFACAIINPNLAYESYAGRAIEAERLAISHIAKIIGFEPEEALGYFTFGGSSGNYWAIRCSLEKAFPGWGKKGFKFFLNKEPIIIQSNIGHYTNINAARLFGIGTENVISIPTKANFGICLDSFQSQMEKAIKDNKQVICIYLIAGCTDSFGIDDIKGIFDICEEISQKYNVPKPHLHVDAAVGWIYCIFRNYNVNDNPLGFDLETLINIKKIINLYSTLCYADSIVVDPHKHGFTSYSSSALIFKNKQDLLLLQKDVEETPYFTEDSFCSFPGAYTPETSRSADGPLMLLSNLYALGYEGYQTIIGYAIQKTNALKSKLEFNFSDSIQILNQNIPGTSVIWRFYSNGIEPKAAYQRELFGTSQEDYIFTQQINEHNYNLFQKGKFMRNSMTPILGYSHQVILSNSGIPISAWKCIMFHPFVDIDSVVEHLINVLNG